MSTSKLSKKMIAAGFTDVHHAAVQMLGLIVADAWVSLWSDEDRGESGVLVWDYARRGVWEGVGSDKAKALSHDGAIQLLVDMLTHAGRDPRDCEEWINNIAEPYP